jgi:hypothetical protein
MMRKSSIIKAIGILTICMFTFLNVNTSVVNEFGKNEVTLASFLEGNIAEAETAGINDGGWFCCLGWGVPCSCWQQPEQTQRCSWCY